jgi:hypothetical protein
MAFALPPGAMRSPQLLTTPARVDNSDPTDSDYFVKQYSIVECQDFGLAQCKAPCECIDCSDSWYTTKKQSEYLLFPYWAQVDDEIAAKTIKTLVGESNLALGKLRQILVCRGDLV